MIYDTLNNLPNYLGMSENLDTVIEYVMARDINTLPAGKTRIDGDKAVVTVSTVTPQVSEKAPFVRHDAHLTLETDLEGSELFEVSLGEFSPTKPADEAAGITVPITAGIMPFMSKAQIQRMVFMCGASLPSPIIKLLARYEDDSASLRQAGIEYACRQLTDLQAHGVEGLHVYTMNNPEIARAASCALKVALVS